MSFEYEYVSYEELYQAYLDCRKRKRNTLNALYFEINDNIKLYNLWKDINTYTYKIGKSICFVLQNEFGTPYREVFAADFRDRIIHHLIVNRIMYYLEEFEFINDSYSCRKGKGILYGVNQMYEKIRCCSEDYTKDCWIYKGDLQNCFNSFNKHNLYKLIHITIKKYFKGKELEFNDWLLKEIIYNIPQENCIKKSKNILFERLPSNKSLFKLDPIFSMAVGNLTTQIIANLYLGLLDLYVTKELGVEYYGRYVDDFYIICKDKKELLEIIKKIDEFLKTIGLTLSHKKIYVQYYKHGSKFIGSYVLPNRKYIINKTIYNFKKDIYNFNRRYNNIKKENPGYIPSFNFVQKFVYTFNSKIGHMVHHNTNNIIYETIKGDFSRNLSDYFIYNKNYTVHINKKTKKLLQEYYINQLSLAA